MTHIQTVANGLRSQTESGLHSASQATSGADTGLGSQGQTTSRHILNDYAWPEALRIELKKNKSAVPCVVQGAALACANCGGAGAMYVFVYTSGPRKYPSGSKEKWMEGYGLVPGWYSGSFLSAPCPVCQGEERRAWLASTCGLTGSDRAITLEEFRTSGAFAGKEEGLKTARAFLAQNEMPRGFVTFWGDVGRGKSHLLKGLTNGFVGVGVHARYINGADMLSEIRDRFGEPNGSIAVESAINFYRRVRVLCLDELDKIYLTGWAEQTLHRLLDARYNEQSACLTVLALNPNPTLLPDELAYLSSRIQGGVVVQVGGPDMRPIQGLRAKKILDLDASRKDLE